MCGFLYEMELGPVVIKFLMNFTDFFDINIQPLDLSGQVYLIIDNDKLDLKQICPNNDRIILKKSYDDGNVQNFFLFRFLYA